MAAKISEKIRTRIQAIMEEQRAVILERDAVIHGLWVARIAQEHLVMVGAGGTGKSMLVRDATRHIDGAVHFETALDETTDPAQVFGPPDIVAMVEHGISRRVTTGMLSEATDAFVDEIFNGNKPTLHSLMTVLNERIFHNPTPVTTPLRSAFAGTNDLNADTGLTAFFDRLHLRYVVDYIGTRDNVRSMVAQAITRMSISGRGTVTSVLDTPTTVTLAELDAAHVEALKLHVDDDVWADFLDLREGLRSTGIVFSDRRAVEGMAAVLANAWLRGHQSVQRGDLDILAHMWWTTQDQIPAAQEVIYGMCNPGEKEALRLLEELEKIRAELKNAEDSGWDLTRVQRVAIEAMRDLELLTREANELLATAKATGASTHRIENCLGRAGEFAAQVSTQIFGLPAGGMTALATLRS